MVTPDLGRLMVKFDVTSKHGGLLGLIISSRSISGKICTVNYETT
jgi:hypothetical protein